MEKEPLNDGKNAHEVKAGDLKCGRLQEKGVNDMATSRNMTVIPATLNLHTRTPHTAKVRLRVAAYARVSTDSEEQLTSYEAQVDYLYPLY